MRVYHNEKRAREIREGSVKKGYPRLFIKLNRNIPELKLFKGNIVEADEYDASARTYTIYTGYGSIHVWKSMCKEI